jgi:hypothetical protein
MEIEFYPENWPYSLFLLVLGIILLVTSTKNEREK